MDSVVPKVTEKLKEDIVIGPMLVRIEPSQNVYIKTYCFKDGTGEVLLQLDC